MSRHVLPFGIAALLLATSAAPATAQASFGLRAGLTAASYQSDVFDFGTRLGFVGGAYARLPLSPAFSVQPEVLYSQEGGTLADGDVEYRVGTLSVPVLGRVAIPVSPLLDVGAAVGPYLAFPIHDRATFVLPDNAPPGTDTEADLNLQAVDYGLTLGVDVGSGPFAVDLRYAFGIPNVFAVEPNATDTEALDTHSRVFSATFSYRFGR